MEVVVGVLAASVLAQFLGNLLYVIVRSLSQPRFRLRSDIHRPAKLMPTLYVANRSRSASQARRAPQLGVGEGGRTTTTTACPT